MPRLQDQNVIYFSSVFCVALCLLLLSTFKLQQFSLNSPKLLIAPPPHLEKMHFGFAEVIADSLWIRAVQDYSYCETSLGFQQCKGNGWLYQMLEAVTDLSPHFRIPYATGGVALSVIVNDIPGASNFFNKAVVAFPKDWPILYRAAYHALYEEKNDMKAAKLLEKAAKNGGGEMMFTLATRLYSRSGGVDLAKNLKAELEAQGYDPATLSRMQKHIDSLGQ
jgi:hypothetical protein